MWVVVPVRELEAGVETELECQAPARELLQPTAVNLSRAPLTPVIPLSTTQTIRIQYGYCQSVLPVRITQMEGYFVHVVLGQQFGVHVRTSLSHAAASIPVGGCAETRSTQSPSVIHSSYCGWMRS